MGVRDWLKAQFSAPVQRSFAADTVLYPINQLMNHFLSRQGGIDRASALTVPAVLRGRNMICSISTLPLEAVNADNVVQDHPLLRQVDANVPNVVTLAMLVEDLLFDGKAWLRITGFGWDGYPVSAVRYGPGDVSLQPPDDYETGYLPSGLPTEGVIWMGGKAVPFDEVIRFDSPNPPLLDSGATVIARALALDAAAAMYANEPRPMDYFTPAEGVDPASDERVKQILDDWTEARRKRSTVYVPAALTYNEVQQPTPADLQLVQLQQRAALDLANMLGLDPEDLGISTTSRTYQNGTDRRKDRINDTLAPYMSAITDRLGMPDVTKRGVTVRFRLDDYLKPDPKTRAEVQAIYVAMGATDAAEVRKDEGRPARTIRPPVPPTARPIPATVGEPVRAIAAAADRAELTFADTPAPGVTFECDAVTTSFAVDEGRRTITGLVVPWNEQSSLKGGKKYRFARGGQRYGDLKRVKYLEDHVWALAFGHATQIEDNPNGLVATFKIARGDHGDKMLALGADGVKDGLSPRLEWDPADEVPDPLFPGGWLVNVYQLLEVSQLANPAFTNSRLISVTASTDGRDSGMPDEETAPVTPETTETAPATPQAMTFTAEQFTAFLEANRPAVPATVRTTVDPTAGRPAAVTEVREELPYRMSYQGGRHIFAADGPNDFSTDLFALMQKNGGTAEAEKRINGLVSETFKVGAAASEARSGEIFADVRRTDSTAFTVPNRFRPDMWLAQMNYVTPLWDMINAGTTDGTKFDIPEFSTSANLVGPATEGTEPAGGSLVLKLQTITPTQVWGKAEITRQAWRAGGNPALSGILWDQMLREYYEDRESAAATFLNTLTAAADILLTTGLGTNAGDLVSSNDLEAAIAALQFVRGGNRFRAFAAHIDLYKMLARVTDTTGRARYPMLNPTNANGTADSLFSTLNVAGTKVVPSWGLGVTGTVAANSWLFDPAKVLGWASAPERLFWDFGATVQTANIPQLSFVTVGIYGDVAFGNTDIAGVRQVIYDPI
jgi:hypothetical protein